MRARGCDGGQRMLPSELYGEVGLLCSDMKRFALFKFCAVEMNGLKMRWSLKVGMVSQAQNGASLEVAMWKNTSG